MTELQTTRISLSTGVTLKVKMGGPAQAEAIVLLHGFPESHRTWRHVAPELARDYRVIVPDQRGFGASDKPKGVDHYRVDETVADIFALADAYKLRRFTLVGHDWGGAIAWNAALKHGDRLDRLVIVNAPHPLIFQRSVIEDPAQRRASQYIRAFRSPIMEKGIDAMGADAFYEKSFGGHVDLASIPSEERRAYLSDWKQEGALTAMLNWYRASNLEVPAMDEDGSLPLWTRAPFPKVKVPTLVVWGMGDKALLPLQLDGLDELVEDLRVVRVGEAGHFVPWERPEPVVAAIRGFMGERPAAS
ncbi:MAG TPA: alpha/beta hydrolase [Allosphingosinicella sp.]